MTINCKGSLINLDSPKIMGIINTTPDSFYDGGALSSVDKVLKQVEAQLKQGADFIDVGGQSTKPGAKFIEADEELRRLLPSLQAISKNFPDAVISVDTFWSKVAKEAIQMGAAIINDVSAGKFDKQMFSVAASQGVPYVLMHMNKMPQNMQHNLEDDRIIEDINLFFSNKINALKKLGINDIILDPGIGFGKTQRQNFEILKNIHLIGFGDFPVLIGLSRKSMICKTLKVNPIDALNGSTAAHMLALQNGAKILRVHDVKEAVECVKIWEAYKNA